MLATMLPSSRPWKEPIEPKSRLSPSRSLATKKNALRRRRSPGSQTASPAAKSRVILHFGRARGWRSGCRRCRPAASQLHCATVSGRASENRSCRADGVHRIAVEVPAQVVEAADEQARAVRQRHAVEGAAPGRGLPPPFAQGIHREHVEHAVAVRGEVDPAVRPPTSGDSSFHVPRGELGDASLSRLSRNRLAAPSSPSAVRSEAKTMRRPSGLGVGSRSW